MFKSYLFQQILIKPGFVFLYKLNHRNNLNLFVKVLQIFKHQEIVKILGTALRAKKFINVLYAFEVEEQKKSESILISVLSIIIELDLSYLKM